jgi:hypothetical protein
MKNSSILRVSNPRRSSVSTEVAVICIQKQESPRRKFTASQALPGNLRRLRGLWRNRWKSLFPWRLLVEREIQLQHVDARVPKQTEGWSFRELRDQLIRLVHGNPASFRDARNLGLR